MRSFISNELEPCAYLIYAVAIALFYRRYHLVRHRVLLLYNTYAAILLYAGIKLYANNNWTYNLLFLTNICVSSWYFYNMVHNKTKRGIIVACGCFNILLFVFVNIIQAKYMLYNSFVYGISYITIVLYSLFYLHLLLTDVHEENLLEDFDFWLICGYLLYFLGSFIIILYYDDKAYYNLRGNMWIMHNLILFICSMIILYVSFRILKKRKLS